jgi:hypothetical protein
VRRAEDGLSSSASATPREALLDALRSATSHNRSRTAWLAAVLWTDKERHWESRLRTWRSYARWGRTTTRYC